MKLTDSQIKHMVDRFLCWKLPEDFNPDGGISFKKTFNDHLPQPQKHEPVGTNLFSADQATAMVRYLVEDASQGGSSDQSEAADGPSETILKGAAIADTAFGRLTEECAELRAQVKRQWKPSDKELAEWALECSDAALEVVRDEAFLPKSAPALRSSLSSGESDPSVTLDCAGADTADENRHEETPISMPSISAQVERTSLDAWIEREFAGHGRAIRTKDEAPYSGEPYMSMADAKELTRRAVTYWERIQLFFGRTDVHELDMKHQHRASPVTSAQSRVRDTVIEECARELETSYPDHAWLNAACAALRSMKSTSALTSPHTKDAT